MALDFQPLPPCATSFLVTATSGQIIVLAEWLRGKDLEKSLVIPELEHNPMAQLAIALFGDPGVFGLAYPENAPAMVDGRVAKRESPSQIAFSQPSFASPRARLRRLAASFVLSLWHREATELLFVAVSRGKGGR